MAVHFFRPGVSENTWADYERWNGGEGESASFDTLDWELLTQTFAQFARIFYSPEFCLMWGRAFGRLGDVKESVPADEERADFPDKHQSCMALAKRAISLFEEDSSALKALIGVCRRTELFFRRNVDKLAFLYRRMESTESLDLCQLAPHPERRDEKLPCPPQSRISRNGQWTEKNWPRNHCVSWDHSLTIFRGLIGDTGITLHSKWGIVANLPLPELLARRHWKEVGETIRDVALRAIGWDSVPVIPEEGSVRCSYSELTREETPSPELTIRLIRAGLPPFVVMDLSEFVTQKATAWRGDAKSPYYIPFFHAACQFGTKEMVEAFLEDGGEALRQYYSQADFADTPYQRALLNEKHPSVLIPLFESGALAREMSSPDDFDGPSCNLPKLTQLFAPSEWREYPENRLLLACVGGDITWAQYVVQEEEAKAQLRLPPGTVESDKQMMAAAVASSLVNQPGISGAPRGTPVEVAARFGHAEIVRFLCEKGAVASLEIRIEATRRMAGKVSLMVCQWEQAQADIRREIDQLQVEITPRQLDEMASRLVSYRSLLQKQQAELQSCGDVLEETDAVIGRLETLVDYLENSSKLVVQHYGKYHPFNSVASLA